MNSFISPLTFQLSDKKIFGITGALSSGKSTVAQLLQEVLSDIDIIEVDDIRRYILWSSMETEHILLRKKLSHSFNLPLLDNSFLPRKALTSLIFLSKDNLNCFSTIVTPYIKEQIYKNIQILSCNSIAIVWAYLLEENYNYLLNSSIILVKTSRQTILKRVGENSDMMRRIQLEPTYASRIERCIRLNLPYFEIENDF